MHSMRIFDTVYKKAGSPRGWFDTRPLPRYAREWVKNTAIAKECSEREFFDELMRNADQCNMPPYFFIEEACAEDKGWDIKTYWEARLNGKIDCSSLELPMYKDFGQDNKEAIRLTIYATSGYGSSMDAYHERLVITKHSIAYKFTLEYIYDKINPTPEWKFSTSDGVFTGNFKIAVEETEKIMSNQPMEMACDTGSFEFVITYSDKGKARKDFWLPAESFDSILSKIYPLVPDIADKPRMFDYIEEEKEERKKQRICQHLCVFYDYINLPQFAPEEWDRFEYWPSGEYWRQIDTFSDWFFNEAELDNRNYWNVLEKSALVKMPLNLEDVDYVDKMDYNLVTALITAIYRRDRIEEGTVYEAYRCGLMTKLIARLREEI